MGIENSLGTLIGGGIGFMVGGPAGAAVGAGIGSGFDSRNAASDAAQLQADSAARANQLQWDMYQQQRTDQQPWRDAGTVALGQLTKGTANGGEFNRNFTLADFNADPGYQFRLQQGQQALERSAAARGGLLNGGTLKALSDYGQGAASQEYQNAYSRYNNDQSTRFNRLASVAGLGQTANNVMAQLGSQTASGMGNNLLSAGAAQAAGRVGGANAMSGALNNATSLYALSRMGGFGAGGGKSYGSYLDGFFGGTGGTGD